VWREKHPKAPELFLPALHHHHHHNPNPIISFPLFSFVVPVNFHKTIGEWPEKSNFDF